MSRYHSATMDCRPRTRTVRSPISAPFARTRGVTRLTGSPLAGSTLATATRIVAVKSGARVEIHLSVLSDLTGIVVSLD